MIYFFQIDNRGNHLVAVDDSGINTPAIAAAHAVKRYTAQAADEISLEVCYCSTVRPGSYKKISC